MTSGGPPRARFCRRRAARCSPAARRTPPPRAALLAAIVALLSAGPGCDGGTARREPAQAPAPVQLTRPAPRPNGYVGSAVCAECHAEIRQTYQQHPMSRSMHSVLDAPVVEDYDAPQAVESARRRFRVERTKDAVVHHEIALDARGEAIYDHAVEVHYAIGSGKRGRSYAVDRDGFLQMSPISWYSSQGRWDLSPGYSARTHGFFERRVTDACVTCHAGRPVPSGEAPHHFQSPPFAETAIGCERCHGPGQAHVELHRSGASLARRDPIVDPSRLDPARRESVCYQCHLQGAERVLRYGRTEFDFRPGDHLGEIWTVFEGDTGIESDGTTRAVSHVQQLRSSACWQRSDGALGCISCHDPHSVPPREEKARFYRARCLQCHGDGRQCAVPAAERQSRASDSCSACHMPRLATSDVPHTAQTDHRILARPEQQPGATGRTPPSPDGLVLFDRRSYEPPPTVERRARGLVLARRAEEEQDAAKARRAEQLLRPVVEEAPADVDALDALAVCRLIQSRPSEAVTSWERALAVDPNDENALFSLGVFFLQNREPAKACLYLGKLVEAAPWQGEHHGRYAHALWLSGRSEEALQAARRGVELDPSLAPLYGLLAEIHQRLGNSEESRAYRELVERLQRP